MSPRRRRLSLQKRPRTPLLAAIAAAMSGDVTRYRDQLVADLHDRDGTRRQWVLRGLLR